MSVISFNEDGWIISHLKYIYDMYANIKNGNSQFRLIVNETFFKINSQYLRENQTIQTEQCAEISVQGKCKKRKRTKLLPDEDINEINTIQRKFDQIINFAKIDGLFPNNVSGDNNEAARFASQKFYRDTFSNEEENFYGCNDTDVAIVSKLKEIEYVFPRKCSFFCYDVRDIERKLDLCNQYDFILLDPPWWNKSIRRKKIRHSEASYKMMYNNELAKIPIGKLLCSNGIVAIWCTNASSHLHSIFDNIFPSWGITYRAKWYWVKITESGNTICNFNHAPGKQPYELLILGSVISGNEVNIPDGKLLISIPSAVHSHKPPLTEIMKEYLPHEPKCLEIFARYLLPGWTSWGLEVLKFQHLSLYGIVEDTNGHTNSDTWI